MKNYLKKPAMFFAGCALIGGLLLGGPKEGSCFMEGLSSRGVLPSEELKIDNYKLLKTNDNKKSTKIKEYTPNPNIKKLVETLLKYPECNDYTLPDGRTVKFEFYGSQGSMYTAHFSVDITKEDKTGYEFGTIRIQDSYLDGLGEDDLVGYRMENLCQISYDPKFEFRKFTELSKETQEKLRKEYNKIIEEAPNNIIKKHKAKELQKIKENNEKKEMFEKNILDLLKDSHEKTDSKNRFSCWIIA